MTTSHLHLGDIRISGGLSAVLLRDTRLGLAQVLAGGVVGLLRHSGSMKIIIS
jgi:hypothetical protein